MGATRAFFSATGLALLTALATAPTLAAPKAAAVIYPAQGPSGTSVMVWACGFDPHPWNNGATPDHFAISVDDSTVIATVPVSQCNNVSVGFGQKTQNPPTIAVKGAPGTHYVFVELVFSNGVGTLAPAVPFTITGIKRLICPQCLLGPTPSPTPAPRAGLMFSPPPPGAFTLSITGIVPPAPIAGQPFNVSYSLTDNWKSFGPPAQTSVVAKLDGNVITGFCQVVNSFNVGQTINRALSATAPGAGQHAITLYYIVGLAPNCPGYVPGLGLRLVGGPFAQATQTFTVGAQPQVTPSPTPAPASPAPTPTPTRTPLPKFTTPPPPTP